MRSIALFLAAAAAFASTTIGDIESRAYKGSEYMSLDFVKERSINHRNAEASRKRAEKRSLRKRAEPFVQTLDNAQLLYYANVSIGNPTPQSVRLQIDSGSSDVWVAYSGSRLCRAGRCDTGGSFNPEKSDNYNTVLEGGFSISYVDGSSAAGDYFTDDFHIGGQTVKNQQMGIAIKTDITEGIMGIGYSINEAIVSQGGDMYPSLIDQLVKQNKINSKAYSLWLNDLDSNTGSILFGGIDTEKYQGKLAGLKLQKEDDETQVSEFAVAFSGFSVTDDNGETTNLDTQDELPIAAVLDSGSSFTVLPNNLADAAASVLNGEFSSQLSTYLVDCSLQADDRLTYDFQFGGKGGPTIRVPLNELVHPAVDNDGNELMDRNGNVICQLGIIRAGELKQASFLFGDTFLRSAYVVYDLDGDMVYIAPTVFNTTKSNVLPIGKASDGGVPDVATTANGVQVEPTGTGNVRPGYPNPTGTKKSTAGHSHQVAVFLLGFSLFATSYLLF